jgi:hypothetical protein
MQTKMIADMSFPYAGREIKQGEEFEALTEDDAFALRVYRRAHDGADQHEPKGGNRRYRRRDMQAEDTQ